MEPETRFANIAFYGAKIPRSFHLLYLFYILLIVHLVMILDKLPN